MLAADKAFAFCRVERGMVRARRRKGAYFIWGGSAAQAAHAHGERA